jgi:hypothetical protein
MDLKKLLLSLAVSVPLVTSGCGDDTSGGPPDGSIDPCEGVTGDVWELTGLTLPKMDPDTAFIDVIGFDLDGMNTPVDVNQDDKTPENGCGVPDQGDGIDNALGQLLALLSSPALAEIFGDVPDIQGEIDAAIASGAVRIDAEIKNYTGAGSEGVTLSLKLNGEVIPALQNVPAEVDESGNITAAVDNLPLALSGIEVGGEPIDLTLNISDAIVFIDAPGSSTTSTATIGGSILYGDETTEGGLRNELANLVEALDLGVGIEVIDSFLPSDMSSTGAVCDSVSLGALAAFRKVNCD